MDHPSTLHNTNKLINLSQESQLVFSHDSIPYNTFLYVENLSSDVMRIATDLRGPEGDESLCHYIDVDQGAIDSILLYKNEPIHIYAKGSGPVSLTLIYLVKQEAENFVAI